MLMFLYMAPGVTEWFDAYRNYGNDLLRPSQSPDLNQVEHLGEAE